MTTHISGGHHPTTSRRASTAFLAGKISSFGFGRNIACTKIDPKAKESMHLMTFSAIDAIRWDLGNPLALFKGSRATP